MFPHADIFDNEASSALKEIIALKWDHLPRHGRGANLIGDCLDHRRSFQARLLGPVGTPGLGQGTQQQLQSDLTVGSTNLNIPIQSTSCIRLSCAYYTEVGRSPLIYRELQDRVILCNQNWITQLIQQTKLQVIL
jgi:hypothetical protein